MSLKGDMQDQTVNIGLFYWAPWEFILEVTKGARPESFKTLPSIQRCTDNERKALEYPKRISFSYILLIVLLIKSIKWKRFSHSQIFYVFGPCCIPKQSKPATLATIIRSTSEFFFQKSKTKRKRLDGIQIIQDDMKTKYNNVAAEDFPPKAAGALGQICLIYERWLWRWRTITVIRVGGWIKN